MSVSKMREHHCGVVNETVRICLGKKTTAGMRSREVLFVKCDQDECQYVDENKAPCPLSLPMFAVEIAEREEKRRLAREEAQYQ